MFYSSFHDNDAAFKFIEIKDMRACAWLGGSMDALRARLSELVTLSQSQSCRVLKFYGHVRSAYGRIVK